jgi:hypothetical protein
MQPIPQPKKYNPLSSYMRQPKIYISLPSRGKYWSEGSLEISENGEYPVYSMTAKDELMFKTPDALLNGQSIVEVIQSCMPNIKNAWDIPTMDFDLILIAIRLATYGDKMPISHKIPVINEDVEYEVDLKVLIDKQQSNTWVEQIAIDENFIVFVKPLTYKHLTKTSIQAFETSRILNMVNDQALSDEQKMSIFNESFGKLTSVTVDLVAESIYKILTLEGEVTDTKFIKEFIVNADKDLFQKIQNHLQDMKTKNNLPPLEFTTTEEQQSRGAPETYSIPVNFNESDFFAQGF